MTLDDRPQTYEGSMAPVAVIDFDKPPTAIERYTFGDAVTRNNFANFLVDDFKRSRGQSSAQAYSWAWLKRHSGVDVVPILKGFIDKRGLRTLTEEESFMIQDRYTKAPHKRTIPQIIAEEDRSFSSRMSEMIDRVIMIYENQGRKMRYEDKTYLVGRMKEEVLAMDRADFLKWQATDGQNEQLLSTTR